VTRSGDIGGRNGAAGAEAGDKVSDLRVDRPIALVGLMGAGKTTIGRRLAQTLKLKFVDADAEIEQAAGMRVSEIFAKHGEADFRRGERSVIARLLSEPPHVLATGGGAFIDPETRAMMKEKAISIWLKAPLDVLMRRGGRAAFPSAVVARLEDGVKGVVAETPATGDPRLARASAVVIGGQRGALEDASRVAEGLGYRVIVVPEPVTGEAREAAVAHVRRVAGLAGAADQPTCVLSSGETTVTVRGRGRGGRNQEFACAAAPHLATIGPSVALGSLGTDGIDGPTDAAGAVADSSTLERAAARGLHPETFLRENDSYTFFDALGDLIRTGPTRTNVGDVQITLVG